MRHPRTLFRTIFPSLQTNYSIKMWIKRNSNSYPWSTRQERRSIDENYGIIKMMFMTSTF